MKRVFISYARDDVAFRDALVVHLQVLCIAGIIESWHDGELQPGEDWKVTIDRELQAADIIVFLVSANFLASKSCQQFELGPALSRWKAREALVIPIIIRACDWEVSPIEQLQVLPHQGKPIVTWPHQDDAWTEVTRKIRGAATHKPDPAQMEPTAPRLGPQRKVAASATHEPRRNRPTPPEVIDDGRLEPARSPVRKPTRTEPTITPTGVDAAVASVLEGLDTVKTVGESPTERNDLSSWVQTRAIDGVWLSVGPAVVYCVRTVSGQIRVAYNHSGGDRLNGEYYNCTPFGDTISGRFRSTDDRLCGYFYWRIQSSESITGGWWYDRDVPRRIRTDLSKLNESLNGIYPLRLERKRLAVTPQWAERFFEAPPRAS